MLKQSLEISSRNSLTSLSRLLFNSLSGFKNF